MKRFISLTVFLFSCLLLVNGQHAALRSGPMVGYGQMTEVMLWVQTTTSATVHYQYWDSAEPSKKLKSVQQKTTEDNFYTAKTLVTGLAPGKKFEYEILTEA